MRAIALDIDTGHVELLRAQTTEYLISKPDVESSVENGVLAIRSNCADLVLLDCTTDFRIEVPAGVAIKARTDVGNVTGTALASSDVRVKTDVGDVEFRLPDAAYATDTDTDVGEIDVNGVVQDDRAPRSITAKTDVGDVTIQGR